MNRSLLILTILLVILWARTAFYAVDASEFVYVTRFGYGLRLDLIFLRGSDGALIYDTRTTQEEIFEGEGILAVTKAALEMLAGIYAQENQQGNVRVNVVDPGRTRTRMRAAAYPGEDPMTLRTPDEIMEPFVRLARADYAGNGDVVKAY